MALKGESLNIRNTLDALRRSYIKWKNYYMQLVSQRNYYTQGGLSMRSIYDFCRELQIIIENKRKAAQVEFDRRIEQQLQGILDSEYLETNELYREKFEEEMLFLSPKKTVAQAFIDAMPCSPKLDAIKHCIQAYIDGKTDIINSPEKW